MADAIDYTPTPVYVHVHAVPLTVHKRVHEAVNNKKLDKEARDYFLRQIADDLHKALIADPSLIEQVVKA